jgi:hypothetical protein
VASSLVGAQSLFVPAVGAVLQPVLVHFSASRDVD